jgi:hypothetical protein
MVNPEAVRELILRKRVPAKEKQIRVIFEKQPFGELERLVAQKLGRDQEGRQRRIEL